MNYVERDPVRLDELCSLITEQVDPRAEPERLYVGLEHLAPGRIQRWGGGLSSEVQSSKSRFRKGDILYGKLRPYLDKAIIADEDGVCSTELLVLRPNRGTDGAFLAGVLHSQDFTDHAMSGVTGVQHPRTSWQRIREFEVPNFAETEQRSIGVLIRGMQGALTACEDSLSTLDELKRAAMRELFTRGLRGEPQKETEIGKLPESWSVAELGDVARIGNGSTPNRKDSSYWNGEVPYITSAKMYQRDISDADEFVTEHAMRDYSLPRLTPGTILMAIVGQGKTLGHCAVLKINAAVSRHVGYLALDEDKVEPLFCRHYIEMQYEYLRSLAAGNGSTRGALTAALLKRVALPIPPVSEQRAIAGILDTLDERIALQLRKKNLLGELFKAILNGLMARKIRVSDINQYSLMTAGLSMESAALQESLL